LIKILILTFSYRTLSYSTHTKKLFVGEREKGKLSLNP